MILAWSMSKDGGLISVNMVLRSLSYHVMTIKMPGGTPVAPSSGGRITSTSLTVNMLFSIFVKLRKMHISRSTFLQLSR